MTDHNREELIRQAALASVKKGARSDAEAVRNYREAARHAEIHLTVFEQAHTLTSNERERKIARLEADLGIEIDRFERLHEMADRLSLAIAPVEIIGEHSSANDPWWNALEYAEAHPRAAEPQAEPTDAQVLAALNAYDPRAATDDLSDWGVEHVADMRSALRAAFKAGGGGR